MKQKITWHYRKLWIMLGLLLLCGKEVFAADNMMEKRQLPQYYDSREQGRQTSIKDQGKLGTCWALTAATALEMGVRPEEQLDFSADHISLHNSFGKSLEEGGDYLMLMAYLAGWQGPVLEEEDPYGDGYSPDGLLPAKHVQEIEMYPSRDFRKIKEAVMENGAVQSSIYMDLENAFSYSIFYNQLEYSYYYLGEELPNHDICIIGWDDHYPAEKFNVHTEKDGAFICQNSWGEEFGDNGIFYVSYEDCTIGGSTVSYCKIEDSDNYKWMDQTDLCGWVGQIGYGDGSCYFANVFQGREDRELEAVGFYTVEEDTSYEIYVLPGVSKPEEFTLTEVAARGNIEEKGFHTVTLNEPWEITAGEPYTVVIHVENENTTYPVATEFVVNGTMETVTISDGDGYISHEGNVWSGTESMYQCNVCMKVYGR